jgi:hypothetical protein
MTGTVRPIPYSDENSFRSAKLEWREWVNRDEGLTCSAQRIATYLIEVASIYGIFPGQQRMACDLGITERSVRDGLAQLEARDWIRSTRNGRMRSNTYKLTANSVRLASLRMRRELARSEADGRRQACAVEASDRNSASGVTGTALPVVTGTLLPSDRNSTSAYSFDRTLSSDPFETIPEERGYREETGTRSYSTPLPDDEEEAA